MSKLIPRESAPPAQEKVVVSRSGNTCAYPGCGLILTIESLADGDRPKATGKVAHICAASPGGPRYDEAMTKQQRGSADNLIYLCGPHHDAVDAQLELHTLEFLREAKRVHEAKVARGVRAGLGDVTYAELSMVCTVLVGAREPLTAVQVDIALPVQQKIQLNKLGPSAVELITAGLSQADRVASFIAFQSTGTPASAGRWPRGAKVTTTRRLQSAFSLTKCSTTSSSARGTSRALRIPLSCALLPSRWSPISSKSARCSSVSELFPDKFTPIAKTLVGEAATILGLMGTRSLSVGQLFVEYREAAPSSPYDSFAAALTLLYGAGAINHHDGILRAD